MVLILKNAPAEGPGLLAEMFEGRGVPFVEVEAYRRPLPLSAAGFTGVVAMGGPMSVNDGLPWLDRERALLRESLERDLPILGVCLGAQLLASALGAVVRPAVTPEVGWGEVQLTEEGRRDPILGGSEPVLPVLHWHGETYDLPREAVHLASTEACPQQAFRFGDRAYGLQFHMEATREMVERWVAEDEAEGAVAARASAIRSGIPTHLPRVQLSASLAFGRFIDRLLRT